MAQELSPNATPEAQERPALEPGFLPWLRRRIAALQPRTRKQYVILALIMLGVLFLGAEWRWTANYSAQVIVTPAPTGGEFSVGINPTTERLDFGDLPQGLTQTRFVTLENGRIPTRVTIMITGGIRDFIRVDDAFFTMGSNETRRVEFEIRVPSTAETKKYSGRIMINRTPWLPWP